MGVTPSRCLPFDGFDSLGPRGQAELRTHLCRFATMRTRDSAVAEDAVQETLTAMIMNQRGEGPPRTISLRGWLFGVLRHKISDQFRWHAREQPVPADRLDGDAIDHDDCVSPSARAEHRMLMVDVRRAIMRLPENFAKPLVLFDVIGLSSDEICERLGLTKNNLYVRLHRARRALREELTEDVLAN